MLQDFLSAQANSGLAKVVRARPARISYGSARKQKITGRFNCYKKHLPRNYFLIQKTSEGGESQIRKHPTILPGSNK